jgi:hypothetical protein
LIHYTKYQRNKRKQRKEDLEKLEKKNSLLLAEVQKLKLIIEQLEQKLLQQIKAFQIVFGNTVNLI